MASKAVFLDRDNTLIEDPGYINHPNQVELLGGVGSALSDMRDMGYKLVIVTNQSGVARGIVTEEVLADIHERLLKLLRKEGVFLDAIYYCPFHPDGVIEKYRIESDLRKPGPGMLFMAAEEMDIDLEQSWMIGDSYRDIEAGKNAGCRTILIKSPTNPAIKEYTDPEPDGTAVNMKEAANIIKMCIRDGRLPFKVAEHRKVPNMPPPMQIVEEEIEEEIEEEQAEPESQAEHESGREEDAQFEEENDSRDQRGAAAVLHEEEYEDDYQEDYDDEEDTRDHYDDYDDRHDYEEEELDPVEKNTRLLEQIADKLSRERRTEMFEEFSMLKVFAGIIQTVVFFCLLVAVWFMLDQTREISTVHTIIGFAIVFQLMAIAFYIMDRN